MKKWRLEIIQEETKNVSNSADTQKLERISISSTRKEQHWVPWITKSFPLFMFSSLRNLSLFHLVLCDINRKILGRSLIKGVFMLLSSTMIYNRTDLEEYFMLIKEQVKFCSVFILQVNKSGCYIKLSVLTIPYIMTPAIWKHNIQI